MHSVWFIFEYQIKKKECTCQTHSSLFVFSKMKIFSFCCIEERFKFSWATSFVLMWLFLLNQIYLKIIELYNISSLSYQTITTLPL